MVTRYSARAHVWTLCVLSGLLGAESITLSKVLAEWFGLNSTWVSMLSLYMAMVLAGMLVCAVGQLIVLAQAMSLADVTLVVPLFQSCLILGVIMGGMMFFQEWQDFSITSGLLFGMGVTICVLGIACLLHGSVSDIRMSTRIDSGPEPSPNPFGSELEGGIPVSYEEDPNRGWCRMEYGGQVVSVCAETKTVLTPAFLNRFAGGAAVNDNTIVRSGTMRDVMPCAASLAYSLAPCLVDMV